MNYLLHVDTATDTGMVAVSGDGRLFGQRVNVETRNHAASINLMVASLLEELCLELAQISAFVVCAGPGSYTGLRIGLATAKGYCYALDKPLIMDSRLTLLAYKAHQAAQNYTQNIVLLVAREKEYFVAIYDQNFNCTLEPQHILEEQMTEIINKKKKTIITTDAPEPVIDGLGIDEVKMERDIKLSPESWSFYAFEKYKSNRIVKLAEAEPFYLKQVYTHKQL